MDVLYFIDNGELIAIGEEATREAVRRAKEGLQDPSRDRIWAFASSDRLDGLDMSDPGEDGCSMRVAYSKEMARLREEGPPNSAVAELRLMEMIKEFLEVKRGESEDAEE